VQSSQSTLCAVMLCATAAGQPSVVAAQASEAWQFEFSAYGWLPSISGSTTFGPPPGGSGDITVDAQNILQNLKFVAMGTFEARRGRWGGFTDFIYLDVGDSRSQSRDFLVGRQQIPAGISGNFDLDLKGTVWTLAGEYRVLPDPSQPIDVFGGARMIELEERLGFTLSGNLGSLAVDGSGSRTQELRNWDAIVGVKGRVSFGEGRRWFVPYYGDIGTGDSELTYQLMTGIGYAFPWGEVVGQWRYLYYDFGKAIDKLAFNGPAIAFNFRW
jgi:hypothetical protein